MRIHSCQLGQQLPCWLTLLNSGRLQAWNGLKILRFSQQLFSITPGNFAGFSWWRDLGWFIAELCGGPSQITGFSLSSKMGLGIDARVGKLNVFQ